MPTPVPPGYAEAYGTATGPTYEPEPEPEPERERCAMDYLVASSLLLGALAAGCLAGAVAAFLAR